MRLIFSLAIIMVVLTSCSEEKSSKENAVPTVKTFEVAYNDESSNKSFSAVTKPKQVSGLSFRIGGVLSPVNLKSGQYFKKGQLLAEVDARDYKIELERAEAVYIRAKAEYDRYRELVSIDNVSKSTFDKVEEEYKRAKENRKKAKNALGDTKLLAPYDGYVQEVFVDGYDEVRAKQQILTFIDLSELEITARVSAEFALKPENITGLAVKFDDIPNQTVPVTLKNISKSTDKTNLSYLLTGVIDNSLYEKPLLGGLSGVLTLESQTAQSNLSVPVTALMNDPSKGTFVWKLEAGIAKRRSVKAGKLMGDNHVEILEGLSPKDKVISAGGQKIQQNQQVQEL
ncbi:efflux RND transporter periplasmic adaptor subunit [Aureibacter tunicatorum]|uniref:RND family efflux transporter MFP subunit n=1 Tax=Aureibacter tunicatorum TaxID=866807 RepID=A0AAE3XQP0_9BACT|nr:efflux RND transporter periplasmic adaptor subunit [Aureibacter tunicatorum]MDR6240269.1 RND family efflux transporter MFP subunit [Aureibacter tunicatorum]BDD05850.1 hemolysin D [Aureibacter tunicatorum]